MNVHEDVIKITYQYIIIYSISKKTLYFDNTIIFYIN